MNLYFVFHEALPQIFIFNPIINQFQPNFWRNSSQLLISLPRSHSQTFFQATTISENYFQRQPFHFSPSLVKARRKGCHILQLTVIYVIAIYCGLLWFTVFIWLCILPSTMLLKSYSVWKVLIDSRCYHGWTAADNWQLLIKFPKREKFANILSIDQIMQIFYNQPNIVNELLLQFVQRKWSSYLDDDDDGYWEDCSFHCETWSFSGLYSTVLLQRRYCIFWFLV